MKKILFIILIGIFLVSSAYALNLSRVKEWSSAEILTAADLNAEFNNILNHSIANADISSSAAIAASKVDFTVASAIGSTTPSTGAFTTLASTGDTTIGDAAADALQVNANTIQFEGATANDYETIFSMPNPTASDNTVTFADIDGTVVTSAGCGANIDIGTYSLTANTLVSDVATGTTPLTISSTTKVTNLDADLLDTYNTSTIAAATTIPVTDASGYVPDASVDTAALKTTTGVVTHATTTYTIYTITGGQYCFLPQIKSSSSDAAGDILVVGSHVYGLSSVALPTSDTTAMGLYANTSHTLTVTTRYVTSSGEDYWIFLLVDKITKDILSASAAPDHPAYGNSNDFEKQPHPFISFDADTQEVILIEKSQAKALQLEAEKEGINALELIDKNYKIDFTQTWPYIPIHSGQYSPENNPVLVEIIPNYIQVCKLILATDEDKLVKENRQKEKDAEYKQKKLEEEFKKNALLDKLGITKEEVELLLKK